MDWNTLLNQLRESKEIDTPVAAELLREYPDVDTSLRTRLLLCAHYVCECGGSDAKELEPWLARVTERCWLESDVELRKRLVWARLYHLMRVNDAQGLTNLVETLGTCESDAGVWQKVVKTMQEWPGTAKLYFDLFEWPALQQVRDQLPELNDLEEQLSGRLRRTLRQSQNLFGGVVGRWEDIVAGRMPVERFAWAFEQCGESNGAFPLSAAFFASKLASPRSLDAELALTLWGLYVGNRRGGDEQLQTPDYWKAIASAPLNTDLQTCRGLWSVLAKTHLLLEGGDLPEVWLLWQASLAELSAVTGTVSETVAQELNKNGGEFLASVIATRNLGVDWHVWKALAARPEFFLKSMAVDVIRLLQLSGHDVTPCREDLLKHFQGSTSGGFGESKDLTLPTEPAKVWVPAASTWGLWKDPARSDDKFMNLGGLFGLLKAVQGPETNYRAQLVLGNLNAGGQ